MDLVEKEIIFRLKVIDEASGQLDAFRQKIDKASSSSGSGNMNRSPKFGEVPGKKGGREPNPEGMISQETANMMRLMGQYRIAWLSTLPKPKEGEGIGKSMLVKGAAALVILQAVGETAKQILAFLEQSSPLLQAEMKILRVSFDMALRPLGDAVANFLRPISRAMLRGEAFAYTQMEKEGKNPATDLGAFYKYFAGGTAGAAMGWDVMGEDVEKTKTLSEAFAAAGEALLISNPIWGTLYLLDKMLKEIDMTWGQVFDIWTTMWKPKNGMDPTAKIDSFGNVMNFLMDDFIALGNIMAANQDVFGADRIGKSAITMTSVFNVVADAFDRNRNKLDFGTLIDNMADMGVVIEDVLPPAIDMTALLVSINPELDTMRKIVVPLAETFNSLDTSMGNIPGAMSVLGSIAALSMPDLSFSWPEIPTFEWPKLPEFSWPSLPEFKWPEITLPWEFGGEKTSSSSSTTNSTSNTLNIGTVIVTGIDKADQGVDYLYNLATGK